MSLSQQPNSHVQNSLLAPRSSILAPDSLKTQPPTAAQKPQATPQPDPLTPTQEALNTRLRDWRKQAAATAGLPSFFIVSDTGLRNIVLAQPQSLIDLRTVHSLDPEKLARYGEAIVDLCRA